MQLPDEAISYQYQSLLIPTFEEWCPATELRTQHFLSPSKIKDLEPRLMQVRSKITTEREIKTPPPELSPMDSGFIDLPQKTLDQHRRQGDMSVLGRVLNLTNRMREEVDRVVLLGIGGSYLGACSFRGPAQQLSQRVAHSGEATKPTHVLRGK
jgi:glucose-6-phosphate isomerase